MWGANLRWENYTANALNQYTQRTVAASADILGTATNTATVTVLSDASGVAVPLPGRVAGVYPAERQGEYFRSDVWFNNSTGAVYLVLTNLAVLPNGANPDIIATNTGRLLVPQTPERLTFDLDGNQTSDGLWTNVWNGENRWVTAESRTTVPSAARVKVDWAYDAQGRRVQKIVSVWNGSTYVPQSTSRFVVNLRRKITHPFAGQNHPPLRRGFHSTWGFVFKLFADRFELVS